jgi:predicted  nucleic acid-binding Zn-ribbon protein
MSQTLSLYRLQQVDSQIDRDRARLQSIQTTLDNDTVLRQAKERVDISQAACQSTEQALKLVETDANNQRIKIEQTEASLYNGKGHSPKELLDLQNDLVALKRHLITLEDIQLDAMLADEEAVVSYQEAQTQYKAVFDNSAEQNHGLHDQQIYLQKELERLSAERAAVAGPIPESALSLYDKLRQQRRGIAVAVINENSCSACGSGLSAAQMQSSRASGSIALCPSCGRILYGS